MSRSMWDRVSAASGIGFAVAFFASFVVAGELPGLDDSAAETASWYGDHRGRVLVGVVLFGIGIALFLWFVGAVANTLRESGEGRPAAVTIAAGSVIAGFASLQAIVVGGLAHSIADAGDTGVVKALNHVQWVAQTLVALPGALFAAAIGVAVLRSGILARWYGRTSVAAAVVFAVSATTWARDGFWAPDGAFNATIGPLIFIAWLAIGSGLLLQRTMATEDQPKVAPMPA